MNKGPSARLFLFHLQSRISFRHLIWIGALFSFIGWRIASQIVPEGSSLSILYLFVMGGPSNWNFSLVEIIAWFMPYLIFFYLFGNKANEELFQRGYLVLPIIGSRRDWWLSNVMVLFVLVIVYEVLYVLALSIGAAVGFPKTDLNLSTTIILQDHWPNMRHITGIQILILIFLLQTFTLFAMASLQMTLSMLLKRSIFGFLTVSIIALLSCIISIDRPWLVRWLPGAQSMLVRHTLIDSTIPGFSIQWSLIYNTAVSIMTILVGFLYLRRMDIDSGKD